MLDRLRTYRRLGLRNLLRVISYRIALKTGFLKYNLPNGSSIIGPYFLQIPLAHRINSEFGFSSEILGFGWLKHSVSEIPDWHMSIENNKIHQLSLKHWTDIPDYTNEVGDIKAIWEFSRFDWVVKFAINYVKSGDTLWLDKLNEWLEDWSSKNPANIGPNWKCGQEASIRVMHLALASHILRQSNSPTNSLQLLINEHIERITPTVSYAIGQDNNHGTSEAAALFIGGSWLAKVNGSRKAEKWYEQGRFWLENRAKRLIEEDGTFSQYSINYHRVMLDTLTLVELWRSWFSLEKFSKLFYDKTHKAIHWQSSMIMSNSGDVPNLGANDGAQLIQLSESNYRDYRPSVQLATAVFFGKRAYRETGSYDEPCKLLEVSSKGEVPHLRSQVFDDGGYVIFRNSSVCLLFNYPKFHFRPSQSDVLHIDLWVAGENLLRDGGTYSYNTDEKWLKYFSGTESHNTIQFDNRDQMPRISRYLFGEWLNSSISSNTIVDENNEQRFEAGYKDKLGVAHSRKVVLQKSELFVTDTISGFNKQAILRWRLMPGDWKLTENGTVLGNISLIIEATTEIKRIEIVDGWESRYYLKKTFLPVLEVEVNCDSVITSQVSW